MRVGHWGVALLGAAAITSGLVAASAAGAAAGHGHPGHPASSGGAIDARVLGTFKMQARVTSAVNVRGEHTGQTFTRVWKIVPESCQSSVCQLLRLDRERSNHNHDHLTLKRLGPGRYAGNGVFYVGLSCEGQIYKHGSRVPFRITLTVQGFTSVQRIRFARRLTATYINPGRTDATPCPLGPSHDAGRYTGQAISPLPQPPRVGFSVQMDGRTDTGSFAGTSHPGRGGGRIVTRRWIFGDPQSGAANRSSASSPTHRFSAPGIYHVRLTVVDSNGLSSTATQKVAAPGPPTASFSDVRSEGSDLFSFSDRSRPGVGGAAIMAWKWTFGDSASGSANTSGSRNPSHTFSKPGTYEVSLTVTDANGRTATTTRSVLAPGPPTARFSATEQGQTATFTFQDQSTSGYGGAPIVGWQWDFGDPSSGAENSSTAQDPSHTFSAPGTYTVTLEVTDANGFTSTTSETVQSQ